MPTEIIASQPAALSQNAAPITPSQLLEIAVQRGASIEQITQLIDLKLKMEADDARKAFKEAFARFKAEAVVIVKNVTIKDGPLKGKKHADLYGVVSAVTPVLSRYGLSHSWKLTRDDKDWMEVTCTISHEMGYSESVAMGAAPDTGPGRNAIQARGSAKSYLERYTLTAALGLAAKEDDDDGNGGAAAAAPQGPQMPEDACLEWVDAIDNAETPEALQKVFTAAYKLAREIGDQQSMKAFTAKKDKRKAEFGK